ncbi:hypothetical protein PAXRUDRAFT_171693 [Paxillus rubicundulus Ve08.2h10]|uniref:Uncharacterized protein n=1 Tax=Paxillus rubicundulus Ve08.2h10 TaxID=930991 RepID=A0A0D0D6K7_9AGAM|nr:hypothetical protein PAXRUDRAFT_171693 [Paxillus rubicundulus Ve08.2h10]
MDHAALIQPPLFPLLPDRNEAPWLASVQRAHEMLKNTYNHAVYVLLTDGAEPTRIAFHIYQIKSGALPLLMDLAPVAEGLVSGDVACDELLVEWLEDAAKLLGSAVSVLESVATNLNNWCVDSSFQIQGLCVSIDIWK